MSAATNLRNAAEAIAADAPQVSKPSNVIEALAAVAGELPAIGKDGKADPKQGGYSYRGIEQITREAQRLFARYQIVFVPRVVHHDIRQITVNDKPWTDTTELVEYDVYGPGGPEDRITIGPILAIGRDNSDKGANKCMTQAFKYALLQTLCISDAKDDSDGQTHEADAPPPPVPGFRASLIAAKDALNETERGLLRDWLKEEGLPDRPSEMNQEQAERVCDYIIHGLPKIDDEAAAGSVPSENQADA